MVLILVICIVSILNCIESIGSGSGGAGLPHSFILTMTTISKSAMMNPTSSKLSFIMLQI